jgi:cytoskeleton protein RodZ
MVQIGQTLRETRMRRRIDITDVEIATKIRAKYLRALENEEWDLLPGSAFVKSFMRTYCDYLQIDGKSLVDAYRFRHEKPPTDQGTFSQGPLGSGRERTRPRRRVSPLLVVVFGAIVLGGVLWILAMAGRSAVVVPFIQMGTSLGLAIVGQEQTAEPVVGLLASQTTLWT